MSPGSTRKGHIEEGELSRGSNEWKVQTMQLSKKTALQEVEEATSAKALRQGHVWLLRVQQGG